MNLKIEKFVYHTCAYSVIISVIFYIFAMLSGIQGLTMSFGRFALIIAFSAITTLAESLLYIKKVKKPIAIFLHFISLFVAFFVVFIAVNNKGFMPSFIFSSLAIFTIIYVLILLSSMLLRKIKLKQNSKKINLSNNNVTNTNNKIDQKYTPRFSGD